MLGEAVDGKFHLASIRQRDGLRREVNVHGRVRMGEKPRVNIGRNNNRQQTVLQRIALEDVREGSADDSSESVLEQRPGSMLTGTAAAEVIAREQNLRPFGPRLVEDEILFRTPVSLIAPVEEELIAESFFRDGLQESRRNDLVRADVIHWKRNQTAFERCEFLHYSNVLTSVTTPVTALAAAVSGLARKVRPPLPCRPSKLRLLVETLYWPGSS